MQLALGTRFLLAAVAMTLILTTSPLCGTDHVDKPINVEVRCNADDGLSLRLRDAIQEVFKSSRLFAVNRTGVYQSRTLVVTITGNVAWESVNGTEWAHYKVDLEFPDASRADSMEGKCRSRQLRNCADQIRERAAKWVGQRK